jgi:integrase/recombinase XerD
MRRHPLHQAKPATPDNDLRRLARQYFEWMAFTNYSELTIAGRQFYLDKFFAWCEDRDFKAPAEITRPVIERYQRHLFNHRQKSGLPLSARGQHSNLIPIRGYFKWLARRSHILHNPAADIDLPRIGHRLPRPALSIHEAEQILAVPDLATASGIRDRAILETFYSSGLRRAELMRLAIHDIDPDRGTLFVRQGKGRKDRVIPVGERAAAWIDKYRREARRLLVREPDPGILFLTADGEPFSPQRLSQLVKEYIDQSGVDKKGACHLFRHTMATLMLENGADVRYIQQMLGHAKLETTQIYTQVSIRQLKHVHDITHPAKNQPHRAAEIIRGEPMGFRYDTHPAPSS